MASLDALRALLLTPQAAASMDAPGITDAAVLVPLFLARGELHGVLTRRRDDLRRHGGEISFPGGRQDSSDEDLRATALREAHEEIGLSPEDVDLVGALPPTGTFVSSYRVHPFVGLVPPGHRWTPQPDEVDEVLDLPLTALAGSYATRRLIRAGIPVTAPTYTVPPRGGPGRVTTQTHLVWGATARIVQSLLERLKPVL